MRYLFFAGLALFLGVSASTLVWAQETVPPAEPPTPTVSEDVPAEVKEGRQPRSVLGGLFRIPARGEHMRPGGEFSLFLPTSRALRDRFGGQWQGFGFGFGRVPVPEAGVVLDIETGWVNASKGSNRITLIPLGLRLQTAYGASNNRPFVGVTGGMLLSETRVPSENLPSRWRGGMNGSAFAGIAFGGNGSVQVGYRWANRIRGFDMSGTSLDFAVRF